MEQTIKCLLLKNDQVLVTEIVEVGAEIGDPNCKLIDPFLLDQTNNTLSTWLEFTDQNEFMIHSDSILTIADPKADLLAKYFDLIS
jgi:hypothetical protein|tara:strand:- start:320 stop:577 length:258 start_codon:yes stop_codon:yes gene_type:complete